MLSLTWERWGGESWNPKIRHSPGQLTGAQDLPELAFWTRKAWWRRQVSVGADAWGSLLFLGERDLGGSPALAPCSQLSAPSSAPGVQCLAGARSSTYHRLVWFVSIWFLAAACKTQFKNCLRGLDVQPRVCSLELSVRTGCVTDSTAMGRVGGGGPVSAGSGWGRCRGALSVSAAGCSGHGSSRSFTKHLSGCQELVF